MLKAIAGLLAIATISLAALPASAAMVMHDEAHEHLHKVQVCKTVWVKNLHGKHYHKVTTCKWVWVK